MKPCISNKKMYSTLDLAEDALLEARMRFDYPPNRGPIAVYQCDDCGCFHLTSKGKMNEKLAQQLANGKIKLQKEANHWLGKLKKR